MIQFKSSKDLYNINKVDVPKRKYTVENSLKKVGYNKFFLKNENWDNERYFGVLIITPIRVKKRAKKKKRKLK
jgi:hypothetical protein